MRRRILAGLALAAVAAMAALVHSVGLSATQRIAVVLLQELLQSRLALNLLLTGLALILIHLLAVRIERALLKGADDINTRHRTRKMVAWGRITLAALVIVLIWASQIQGLGVFLGMLGAGLTLSVQESLLCIAGWGLILTRKPFDIGDRIQVGEFKGDVIDIRLFYSTLIEVGSWCAGEQSTGRIVHVPNSHLFRQVNLNYTQGFPFIWNEATVVVTFESDWEKGRTILSEWAEQEAAKLESEVRRYLETAQEHFPIKYRTLSPIVYVAVADHGVALTLRYLCPVRRRRGSEHDLAMHVLRRFAQTPEVEFAYPTTRFYSAGESAPAGSPPPAGPAEEFLIARGTG